MLRVILWDSWPSRRIRLAVTTSSGVFSAAVAASSGVCTTSCGAGPLDFGGAEPLAFGGAEPIAFGGATPLAVKILTSAHPSARQVT